MKKTCLAVHFTKGWFWSICWQKSCGFSANVLTTCLVDTQARFLFFFSIYPLNYLLHVGLMLTISKMFKFLSTLLCLHGDREYPGSFQNKLVSSSFEWVPKYILFLAKLKSFLEWKSINPMNYLLHEIVMLIIIKVLIILFLLVRIGKILAIFIINQ